MEQSQAIYKQPKILSFGLYTPYLPKDLLPEKIQFIKVELLVPVAKCNAPPFELELEFASFPRNWIPEKEITLPAEETAPPKFDELPKNVLWESVETGRRIVDRPPPSA